MSLLYTLPKSPSKENIHAIRNLLFSAVLKKSCPEIKLTIIYVDDSDLTFIKKHLQAEKVCGHVTYQKIR